MVSHRLGFLPKRHTRHSRDQAVPQTVPGTEVAVPLSPSFAAPSAAGPAQGIGDPVGHYSLFPIIGCTQLKAQPLCLGTAGIKQGHGHKCNRDRRLCPVTRGDDCSPGLQEVGCPGASPAQDKDVHPLTAAPNGAQTPQDTQSPSPVTQEAPHTPVFPVKHFDFSPCEKKRCWSLQHCPR